MRPTRTLLGKTMPTRTLLIRMKVMRQNPLRALMRKRLRDPRLLVPPVNRGLRASRVPRPRLMKALPSPRPEKVRQKRTIALPLRSRKNKLHRPRRKALLNPRPGKVRRRRRIALPLRSRKNRLHRPRRKALLRKKSTRVGRPVFSWTAFPVESNSQCCCRHWLFSCKVCDAATFLPQVRHWQGWLRVCTEVQFRGGQEIFFCYNFLYPPESQDRIVGMYLVGLLQRRRTFRIEAEQARPRSLR